MEFLQGQLTQDVTRLQNMVSLPAAVACPSLLHADSVHHRQAVGRHGPPLRATTKIDGVLGISYRHLGRVRWTTRGRLDSPPRV